MAITFTYTESTNIVVQTEGTEGTPATFADFVTADRAGTATDLLLATAGLVNNTLTYQIRPVEDLAIIIKCIVAAKTAEADFIFITGTDAWGAAQTESLDVTAGNATYTTTLRFQTITNLDCSDNAAGGGNVWDDGTIQVTQDVWGVIWDKGNSQYQIDAHLEVGSGGTPTYFKTINEAIVFPAGGIKTKTDGTFYLGEASNEYSKNGSYLRFIAPGSAYRFADGGDVYIYGSILKVGAAYLLFMTGNVVIKNSIFIGFGTGEVMTSFNTTLTSLSIDGLYFTTVRNFDMRITPTSFTNVHIENNSQGFQIHGSASATATGLKVTNATWEIVQGSNTALTILDPDFTVSDIYFDAGAVCMEKYTCNIHIADKDGADLASASVDCEYANLVEGSDNKTYKCIQDHTAVDADHKPITGTDWTDYWVLYSDTESFAKPSWETGFAYKFATTEFSTQTTDANGDITEQNVQYKKWVGTTEYEEVRLHKFTINLPGYETLVKENITVDAPIVWRLELQPMRARNYARSRVQGVQFQ